MRFAVIGGGAVGLLCAARLQRAGRQVQIVTRTAAQAQQLETEGLFLKDLHGDTVRFKIAAVPLSTQLPEADVYLLAVKQTHLAQLLPILRTMPKKALLLAMQNGMGHGEMLSAIADDEQLYLAVNTEGAKRISPIEVEHTGEGKLRIGPWQHRALQDPRIASLLAVLHEADIQAEYVPDVQRILWDKLIANALINPLTAIFEVPNGMLLEIDELTEMMRQLYEEAAAVADCCGQKFNKTSWQEIVTICRNTSRNTSSMLQDLLHGKQTEIEAITGYIVQKGKEFGISTPGHETLRKVVRLKEQVYELRKKTNGG